MGRENFEVGKLCISSNGDAYFRARILEISDTGANIHFIDYGDCLEVADDLVSIFNYTIFYFLIRFFFNYTFFVLLNCYLDIFKT